MGKPHLEVSGALNNPNTVPQTHKSPRGDEMRGNAIDHQNMLLLWFKGLGHSTSSSY